MISQGWSGCRVARHERVDKQAGSALPIQRVPTVVWVHNFAALQIAAGCGRPVSRELTWLQTADWRLEKPSSDVEIPSVRPDARGSQCTACSNGRRHWAVACGDCVVCPGAGRAGPCWSRLVVP